MSNRRTAVCLTIIVAAGFILRFRAANHPYISQWDEAYHALVAKNLVAHPLKPTLYKEKVIPTDDREWTKAGVWLHKPPLPLWFMAAGIAVFGEGELSFRLASVVLDTGAILLVFLLAIQFFGGGALPGLVAAGLYAINPLMIRLVSGRIPDDTPHVINVFFIILTTFLFSKAARNNDAKWAGGAGFSLGLGTLCMSAVALLGLAASLPLLIATRGLRGTFILLRVAFVFFLASAMPWPWYALNKWPDLWRHESALHIRHLVEPLEGHAHAWWWYVKIFAVQYGGVAALAWLAGAAVLVYAAREAWRRNDAGLASALAWLAIPYVFFSLIATKLYAYTAIAVPAFCLLAGFAVASLWGARKGPKRAVVLGALLAAGTQASLVALERVRADYSVAPWSGTYDYPSFRRVMLKLREVPGPKVLLGVGDNKSPQAMYYAATPAYPDAPSAALVRDLLRRGYRVFVLAEEGNPGAAASPELKTREFRGKIFYIPVPSPLSYDAKHPYEA